jgi:hypothetical protein
MKMFTHTKKMLNSKNVVVGGALIGDDLEPVQ